MAMTKADEIVQQAARRGRAHADHTGDKGKETCGFDAPQEHPCAEQSSHSAHDERLHERRYQLGSPRRCPRLGGGGDEREQAAEAVHRQTQHRPKADHERQELRKAVLYRRNRPLQTASIHERQQRQRTRQPPQDAVRLTPHERRSGGPHPHAEPETEEHAQDAAHRQVHRPRDGRHCQQPGHAAAQHPGDRPGQQTIARHDRTSRSDSASKLMVCTMSGGKNTSRTQSSRTRSRFSRLGSFDR